MCSETKLWTFQRLGNGGIANLIDIGFVDQIRGYILASGGVIYFTTDGGQTWLRKIDRYQQNQYNRLQSISFLCDEGWIVGRPSFLLHSTDRGSVWGLVSLSTDLPGLPLKIFARGKGKAELVTDRGAIYLTKDIARTWRSCLIETVDATLNRTISSGISGASYFEGLISSLSRSEMGIYVAVSSRGNFYLTYAPGDYNWVAHNRPASRRIQSMGWTPLNHL